MPCYVCIRCVMDVIKRDGNTVSFDSSKISKAIQSAMQNAQEAIPFSAYCVTMVFGIGLYRCIDKQDVKIAFYSKQGISCTQIYIAYSIEYLMFLSANKRLKPLGQ